VVDYDEDTIERLEAVARGLRRHVLRMTHAAQSGHPGGSLSAADVVAALYFHILRVDPGNPRWEDRDRFILSKGHACPVLYAALAEKGFFSVDELLTFRQIDSRLQGHPELGTTPGVEACAGAEGQGLSIGIGMALAARLQGRAYRVYVLMGDGENDVGQTWEAAMTAPKWRLDNLTAIVDRNGVQQEGRTEDIMPLEPLADKWRAFNWHVLEIDGHDMRAILDALAEAQATKGKPTCIVARTVKGKGVSFMEKVVRFHGEAPTDEELRQALAELGEVTA
jgi:transketolase